MSSSEEEISSREASQAPEENVPRSPSSSGALSGEEASMASSTKSPEVEQQQSVQSKEVSSSDLDSSDDDNGEQNSTVVERVNPKEASSSTLDSSSDDGDANNTVIERTKKVSSSELDSSNEVAKNHDVLNTLNSPASSQNSNIRRVDRQESNSGSEKGDSDSSPTKNKNISSDESSDENKQQTEEANKKQTLLDSDDMGSSEDEQVEQLPQKVTQDDLFGDYKSTSSGDDSDTQILKKKKTIVEDDRRSYEEEEKSDNEEAQKNSDDEDISGPRLYADPDEEPEEEDVAPTLIDLEMAKCRAELGSEGALFVKFPNFLSVDTKPFDAETYEDEIEDDDVLDEEGRTRLKLKIENTIRWRLGKDRDGNEIKESNAKMVKWSDGTMSLYLGNEVFDVEKQKIMDHNHLFIRQGAGLEAQSVFTEKLIFRPHSTETMTHRKVTLNMADKSSKTQKIKVLASVGDNPDQHKQELIRKEEERLRAKARRESQQRSNRDRPRQSGLSSSFLEGYDDDDETSLSAIKRSYQHRMGGNNYDSYSSSHQREQSIFGESDSEDEMPEKAKKIGDAKIDSDDSASDIESHHPQKTTKRRIIEEDDED